VIQHALEISTTRLETLEAERRFRTMGDLADCA